MELRISLMRLVHLAGIKQEQKNSDTRKIVFGIIPNGSGTKKTQYNTQQFNEAFVEG